MYKETTLNAKEIQERCEKVFAAEEGDIFYNIIVEDGRTEIPMDEIDEDGYPRSFIFEPDMSKRPGALAYLLGERNDFND